jgi:hypothetical protein
MLTRVNMMRLGLLLLGVILTLGFFAVLDRRFAEGGLYPHYASFRTDPLGTSALYETLDRLGSYEVSRNLKPLNNRKELDKDTVILLLGYPREDFDSLRAPQNSEVLRAVEAGARLVITVNPELVPEAYKPELSEKEEKWIEERRRIREERMRRALEGDKETPADGKPKEEKEEEEEEEEENDEERLEREMTETVGPLFTVYAGFALETLEGFQRPEGGWEASSGETLSAGGVPAELPNWRSQYRFEIIEPAWKSVGLVGDRAVIIERSLGKGSIVVTTDSYFVSNESLHFGAEPAFLLWLLGDKKKVVFDETIHGTTESGGAMKLIRRYRAHGVFLGLLVFLVLWAWRSASSLVPGSDEHDRGLVVSGDTVAGEETGSGFIRLLRRSVPPSSLLPQSVEVWKGSLTADLPAAALSRVEELLAEHRRDPKRFGIVETYAAIAGVLRKR